MRRLLRILKVGFFSLFTIKFAIDVADWLGRWEWFKGVMSEHPRLEAFVHTPFISLVFLALGFGSLWYERQLKLPNLRGKFLNVKLIPRMKSITFGALAAEQNKTPGWDTDYKTDWDWLVEVRITNESEMPTTIEEVEVEISAGPAWIPSFLRKKRESKHLEDLSDYRIDNLAADIFDPNRDLEIPSLMANIKGIPLTIGIGHRGWLRFELLQVTRSELNKSRIRIWMVDSMDEKHEVHYERGSDKKWDPSLSIVPNVQKL